MKRSGTVSLVAASFGFAVALPVYAADSDAEFVKKAASAGMMEVELGKHAQAHAEHADVRAFGKRMVDDHTKAGRELEQVAKSEGIAVPKAMSDHDREETEELGAKRGADFDDDYMDDMVDGHEHVIEAFREQAAEGKTAIDLYAKKTLPTLEAHLAQAKVVKAKVDDMDDDDDDAASRPRDLPPVGTQPRGEPGGMKESLPGTQMP
jgi:putative membrane protein